MKELSALNKPFKYVGAPPARHFLAERARQPSPGRPHPPPCAALRPPPARAVTTTLTQKTGASVQTATSQFWDLQRDSYVAYKYENEQMQALTTVFGVSI